MTLTPLAIALQGIGFSALRMASHGLLATIEQSTGAGSTHKRPRILLFPHIAVPHRRPRHRRQDDILFL